MMTAMSMFEPILILTLILFFFLCIELKHKLRPFSPLLLTFSDWKISNKNNSIDINGWLIIKNPHPRMEIMVPEIKVKTILLGKEGFEQINIRTNIQTYHPGEKSRKDGYWPAYIVKCKEQTRAFVTINLEDEQTLELISNVENVWVEVEWINYGPFGRLNRREGTVVPIKKPIPLTLENAYFQQYKHFQLLPLKTHLLGSLDEPIEVIFNYVKDLCQKGDVLTIGETPIAIMQGRYIHPSNIKPSFISRVLCSGFHPTSSLATACGMQALIDIYGPTRILIAFIGGFIGKVLNVKGIFYILAGAQARLIDDITGTTPPYDQTIVLGPKSPKQICAKLSERLGIDVAIVDVNDLGRVKILAANKKCNRALIRQALVTNPAGNANEQTPLVIVRPLDKHKA